MVIVVVDINSVSAPIPVAAARSVITRNDPGGAVVKDDAARARLVSANDIDLAHVVIAAERVAMAGPNAVMVVVPPGVMRIMRVVPTSVPTVVVALLVVIALVLVPAFVLTVVVALIIVAVSLRRSKTHAPRQGQKQHGCRHSSHFRPSRPGLMALMLAGGLP